MRPQTAQERQDDTIDNSHHYGGAHDGGGVGLEASLLKYERGNFLIQYCRGVLNTAEKQIEQLSEGPDGSLVVGPGQVPSPEAEE